MLRSRKNISDDLQSMSFIRLFVRESLTLHKLDNLLEANTADSIELGGGLVIDAVMRPMTRSEAVYFNKNNIVPNPIFVVTFTYDFNFVDLTADLQVNDTILKSYKINQQTIIPVYFNRALSLSNVQDGLLKLAGNVVKGSTLLDIDAVYNLKDIVNLDTLDKTQSGYMIELNLSTSTSFVGKTGREMEIPQEDPAGRPVLASDVLQNPSSYSLSLGYTAVGQYSRDPIERPCPEDEPDCNTLRPHYGIDITRTDGTTKGAPVVAPLDGISTLLAKNGSAGNEIQIKHEDGSITRFLHLDSFASNVATGKKVIAGNVIGYVGDTGRSFGAHLHFEVYPPGGNPNDGSTSMNPNEWLAAQEAWFPVTTNRTKYSK